MLKILCSILIVITSFQCLAQVNFQKGLVITNQQDTLKGYIDQRDWLTNPLFFTYATSPEGTDSRTFTTADIRYFEIWGSTQYIRYSVSISMDAVELSRLSTSTQVTTRRDSVFLQVLQTGKNVSLFSLTDKIKTRFYILQTGNLRPEELNYQRIRVNGAVKTSEQFKYQLSVLAEKYQVTSQAMGRLIGSSNYEKNDLLEILNKINGSVDEPKSRENKERLKSGSGFYAGLDWLGSTIYYSGQTFLANGQKNTLTPTPFLVGGYDFWLNPQVGQLVFRAELLAGESKFEVTSSTPGPYYSVNAQQNVTQKMACLSTSALYNFYSRRNVKLFGAAGIRASATSIVHNTYTSQEIHPGAVVGNQIENYPDLIRHWLCPVFSAGVVLHKKFEVAVTYALKTSITDYTLLEGSIMSLQAGLRYHF